METRTFGPTGVALPVIGQGTWHMESESQAAIRALQTGIDLGMTHIDTAEMYGDGQVEQLTGRALAGRRDGVYLVSKVLPANASRSGTITACERSLANLKTDRLDLYLLHWPGDHPLEDTVAAFRQLVADGKILRWGVSNFEASELRELLSIAEPGEVVCNQVLYHLGERAIEAEVIPCCRENQIAVVAYSPFGSGEFVGAGSSAG